MAEQPHFVEITAESVGGLHVRVTHGPSGSSAVTDAPKDNGGDASGFSPTDLVATGLLDCMMTTMAIVAKRENTPWGKTRGRVEKHMHPAPRRIGTLVVDLWMPSELRRQARANGERRAHLPGDADAQPGREGRDPLPLLTLSYGDTLTTANTVAVPLRANPPTSSLPSGCCTTASAPSRPPKKSTVSFPAVPKLGSSASPVSLKRAMAMSGSSRDSRTDPPRRSSRPPARASRVGCRIGW